MKESFGLIHVIACSCWLAIGHAPGYIAGNQSGARPVVPKTCEISGGAADAGAALIAELSHQPTPEKYKLLGDYYLEEQNLGCATFAFESAIQMDPGATDARYELALILIQAGKPERAVEELRVVIRQTPDSVLAHNALGLALQDHGNLDAAVEEFMSAVNLDPDFDLGYYNLGFVLNIQKRFKAAAFYLQKAAALKPQEYHYQIALAIAYAQDEKYKEAIDLLRKLISLYPDSVEAYVNLGTVYTKQKAYEGAIDAYTQVLRLDPQNVAASISLGIARIEAGQQSEAIPQLAIQASNLQTQGNDLLDAGKPRDAAAAYRDALNLDPENPRIHYNLSIALARLGEHEAQQKELETTIALTSSLPQAYYDLGLLHMTQNKQEEAERAFKNALRVDPGYSKASDALARMGARSTQ